MSIQQTYASHLAPSRSIFVILSTAPPKIYNVILSETKDLSIPDGILAKAVNL